MDDKPRKDGSNAAIPIVLACLLAAYVGGYFLLGTLHPGFLGLPPEYRSFPGRTFVMMYKPMGLAESKIRGTTITVVHSDRIGDDFDFNVAPAPPDPPPEYFEDVFDVAS